ncbi:MAG: thioredoxin-disulfide reductase [Acidobacteriota bacterium]
MSKNIFYLDSDQFEKEVLKSEKPVIVDFYSDECPPCEVLAPVYEKMAEKYGQHIKFVKMHRQDNRELAVSLNVFSSPTVMFYKDGQEVGTRLNGFMSKPQVRMAIEDILGDVIPPVENREVESDVVILGAGPAGLSAAIYAARAKLNVVVIDVSVPGGQAATTYHIANYPGTPGVIRGPELIANMREQALSFGAVIDDLKEVFEVDLKGDIKTIQTEDTIYRAPAVIIATGAKPRTLPAEGADEFKGRGVHYCATCDGAMYEGREVVVVGGGNSAVEEALYLTRFATRVTIIHQFDQFQATRTAQEEAFDNEKIDVIWDSEVRQVNGAEHSLTGVVIENLKTGEVSEVPTDGAFVYIGYQPASDWFTGQIDIDNMGYIAAGEDTEASRPGVYAAGDIRTKPFRQVVTAASDGAVAGIMAEKYIVERKADLVAVH